MSEDEDPKVTIEEIDPVEKAARQFAPMLIVRGILGILGGIVLFFWPTTGLAVVAVVLGVFLTADGVERLVTVLRYPAPGRDVLSLIGAVLRIVFGAILALNPVKTGGFWISAIFILAGLNMAAASLLVLWRDPDHRRDPMSAGTSVLMLLLGLFMILLPMVSALFLFRILGVILVLAAVPSLTVGLRSRN